MQRLAVQMFGLASLLLLANSCLDQSATTKAEVVRLMQTYSERGRHDEAIRVGREWLQSSPDDGDVHVVVGLLLIAKAERANATEAGGLARQAVQHADRAAATAHGSVELQRTAALTLERAADLLTDERCTRYGEALELLEGAVAGVRAYRLRPHSELLPQDWQSVQEKYEDDHKRIRRKSEMNGCVGAPS